MSAQAAGAAGHPLRPDFPLVKAPPAASPRVPAPGSHPVPAPGWSDLAANRAGCGAEERAHAARNAFPVKSALGRLFHVSTEETEWRLGAVGQRKVGLTLSKLGSSWRLLHSVPVGGPHADIDHLVIGPPGLFTLTTKYRRGAFVQVYGDSFRVDGAEQPYVSEARYDAWRAACLLTAACGYRIVAAPAIVVVGAEDVCVAKPAEGVQVLARRHLLRWLTGLPHRLKPAHVDHIFAAARRSDTWLRRPVTLRGEPRDD